MDTWVKVVFAGDCKPCEMCDEPVCYLCGIHYADCECPGPHQDDEFEYKEIDDGLYARRLESD